MALTKAQIIEVIAEQTGFTKRDSAATVEAILEIIKGTLEAGEDALSSGFGKFCVKEKRARNGRNPSTGEPAIITPKRVVTFRCSKRLKERING